MPPPRKPVLPAAEIASRKASAGLLPQLCVFVEHAFQKKVPSSPPSPPDPESTFPNTWSLNTSRTFPLEIPTQNPASNRKPFHIDGSLSAFLRNLNARHAITAVPGTPAGFPESKLLNPFHRPQLRAACPRISILFFFRCGDRFLGQHPEVLVLNTALAEGILYHAIFQRMKTDHHHASSWLQNPRRRCEQRLQIVQFTVYEDSKSLKSPGRRMDSPLFRIHWPGRS
jgi:hypothetical protein